MNKLRGGPSIQDVRAGHVQRRCSGHCDLELQPTAEMWKQPKCPPMEEWIKKIWYIYTMQYCSVIEKNTIMPFAATLIDLEIFIQVEVSQTLKTKYMVLLTCEILKKVQMNLQNRSKICRKQTYSYQRMGNWD